MWKGVISFCRDHVFATVCVSLITGALGGYGVGWSLYEARVNRIEEMKIESVKDLSKERETFLLLMQSFTSKLINDGSLDAQKKEEIAASLAKQYLGYGRYAQNLPAQDIAPVKKLQTSLNALRKSLLAVRTVEDLDPVYLEMKGMFEGFKVVDPLIDRSIRTDQIVAS